MTKMTTKKIIVITAFLLVFIAAVASASETLNGTVVNTPSADRIPNANVTLSFLDGTLIATTLTDANGFYNEIVFCMQEPLLHILSLHCPQEFLSSSQINL